jgi:hypothetical protein
LRASSQLGRRVRVTKAIIDITRANSGTERKLVGEVLEQDSSEFTRRPVVVGFDGQKAALGGVSGMVEFHPVGTWIPEPEIARIIAGLIRTSITTESQIRCKIYSFHPSILAKQGDLAPFDGAIDVIPLRNFIKNTQNAGTEWPDELMPLDTALGILVQSLETANATADSPVTKTDIRQLLTVHDRRFSKQAHPMAALPGFITLLLNKGVERGLIQIAGVDPKVKVFLPSKTEGLAELAQTKERISPAPSLGTMDATPAGTMQLNTEDEGRSKLFQTILRRTDFGVFPEVRMQFYSHMQEIANERGAESLTARELTRAAVARTRDGAPPVFEGRKKGDLSKEKYAWRKLEEFGMRAMARAGLLRGDDDKTTPDIPWLIPNSIVKTPLPDDLPVRLDAEMILEIIRHCPNIGWDDRIELAGAILNGRSEELTDRIERMILLLMAEQKIDWDQNAEVLRIKIAAPVVPVAYEITQEIQG